MRDRARNAEAEQTYYLLHLCVRLLHGFGSHILRDAGLRPPQIAFLGFLHEAGPLSMSAISKFTNVTVSVATRFIERLEGKGLVERVPDEKDRRVVLVRLSDEGNRMAGDLIKAGSESLNKALGEIDRDDFKIFCSVLSLIIEKMAADFPLEHFSEITSTQMREAKEAGGADKR
ncbi:MAG: MarR family transcriptional regulator [Actinomycetota bacterium]